MSNILSFVKAMPSCAVAAPSNQAVAAIWVTSHLASRVRLCPIVREIDSSAFFADQAIEGIEDAYGAALRFLDNLMEDMIFWESL